MVCFQRLHTYVCHVKQSFLKSPLFQRSIRVVSSRLHLFSYFCWIAKTIAVERITVKVVIMLSSFLFCETPIIHFVILLFFNFGEPLFRYLKTFLPLRFFIYRFQYLLYFFYPETLFPFDDAKLRRLSRTAIDFWSNYTKNRGFIDKYQELCSHTHVIEHFLGVFGVFSKVFFLYFVMCFFSKAFFMCFSKSSYHALLLKCCQPQSVE